MAEGNVDQIPKEEFIAEVRNSIREDWRHAISANRQLNGTLNSILGRLCDGYQPRRSGNWLAEPRWTEMFQWTSCPLNTIRGIFLLMEPLNPSTPSYRSTGYALGFKRRQPCHVPVTITKLATVWNFLRLLHEMFAEWTSEVEVAVAEGYRNVFNPEYLSRQHGFLFLNVALTKGPAHNRDRFDRELWHGFVRLLLEEIGNRCGPSPIPVVQLYNCEWIERFFHEDHAAHFHVFRPAFMNVDAEPKIRHIADFGQGTQNGTDPFTSYIMEIETPAFERHRRIWEEILEVIKYTAELF